MEAYSIIKSLFHKKFSNFKKTLETKSGILYYNSPRDYYFEFKYLGTVIRDGDITLIARDGKWTIITPENVNEIYMTPKRVKIGNKIVLFTGYWNGKKIYRRVVFRDGVYDVLVSKDEQVLGSPKDCDEAELVLKFPAPINFSKAEAVDLNTVSVDGTIITEDMIEKTKNEEWELFSEFGFDL